MPLLYSILSSRVANILVALLVGYGYGWFRTDLGWRRWEAKQEAARQVVRQMELAREAQNAAEIAKAATERAAEDAAQLAKLQKQIDDFDRSQAHDPCTIDDAFHAAAGKLRQPPRRPHPAKVARPPK